MIQVAKSRWGETEELTGIFSRPMHVPCVPKAHLHHPPSHSFRSPSDPHDRPDLPPSRRRHLISGSSSCRAARPQHSEQLQAPPNLRTVALYTRASPSPKCDPPDSHDNVSEEQSFFNSPASGVQAARRTTMDPQWSQYADSPASGRQARYAPQGQPQQQHTPAQLPPMKTDPYVTSAVPSRAQSMSLGGHSAAPSRGPYNGDGDGDVQMEDADPYNRAKHDGRPGHSRMNSAQMIQQEESTAARRYSPMNLTNASPYGTATPYAATPQQPQKAQFAAFSPGVNPTSQSPTRNNFQLSPSQHGYYSPPGMCTVSLLWCCAKSRPASRPHAPQLPPLQSTLNAESYYPQSAPTSMSGVYGRGVEPKSPIRATASTQPPLQAQRGPVPKFAKCSRVSELQPRINDQPPFRRANPEGGFLSVSGNPDQDRDRS